MGPHVIIYNTIISYGLANDRQPGRLHATVWSYKYHQCSHVNVPIRTADVNLLFGPNPSRNPFRTWRENEDSYWFHIWITRCKAIVAVLFIPSSRLISGHCLFLRNGYSDHGGANCFFLLSHSPQNFHSIYTYCAHWP